MRNIRSGAISIIEKLLVILNLVAKFQALDIEQSAIHLKKARYTYYAAPDFNNDDSRIIYDEYLNAVGMAEDTDKAFDDNYIKNIIMIPLVIIFVNTFIINLIMIIGAYAKEFMKSRDTSNDNKSNS